MWAMFKNEWKSGWKNLLIWAIAVGGMGLACILLYSSMEGEMADIADSMAAMGPFAEAFGMSTLSIATLKGFFATEVGTIHSLGSSMFAASVATVMLSKEEDNHTAEFTFTLPVSRAKVIAVKFLNLLTNLVVFTLICYVFYALGFVIMDEKIEVDLAAFLFFQFLMNLEVAAICSMISAYSRKNRLGIGISVAMVLYAYDLMARVVPKLEDAMFISPFSYANATSIFAKEAYDQMAIGLGVLVSCVFVAMAWISYQKKDLAS